MPVPAIVFEETEPAAAEPEQEPAAAAPTPKTLEWARNATLEQIEKLLDRTNQGSEGSTIDRERLEACKAAGRIERCAVTTLCGAPLPMTAWEPVPVKAEAAPMVVTETEGGALIRYDAMCLAIAAAHEVDEVKDIRDQAIAFEVYSRQARNKEAERQACEIRLRAERKAGEISKRMETAPGMRTDKPLLTRGRGSKAEQLSKAGVSKKQAENWEKLANVPDEKFEAALADKTTMPTTSGIIRASAEPPALDLEAEVVDDGDPIAGTAPAIEAEPVEDSVIDLRKLLKKIRGEALFGLQAEISERVFDTKGYKSTDDADIGRMLQLAKVAIGDCPDLDWAEWVREEFSTVGGARIDDPLGVIEGFIKTYKSRPGAARSSTLAAFSLSFIVRMAARPERWGDLPVDETVDATATEDDGFYLEHSSG